MKNNKFLNLVSSDFYKVSKLKSTYIALAIMFFMMLIGFAAIVALQKLDTESTLVFGKDFLFSALSDANIGLFIAIIAGIFIGKEFSDGMMRITVARGHKRVQIYFSKLLVMITMVFAYALIMIIIAGIFTAIIGYGQPFDGHEFGLIMRCLAFEILALISSASIFVMFAFLLRSSGSTIGAAIGFYLVISIIVTALTVVATTVADSNPDKAAALINASTFLPYQQSSIASSYGTLTTTEIVSAIVMPIIYTAISSIIGCLTFIKRDVK